MAKDTKVIDDVENTSEIIENKKSLIKIELLCDVYAWNELQKAWTILELEKEELEKYSESFYKKL